MDKEQAQDEGSRQAGVTLDAFNAYLTRRAAFFENEATMLAINLRDVMTEVALVRRLMEKKEREPWPEREVMLKDMVLLQGELQSAQERIAELEMKLSAKRGRKTDAVSDL